METASTALFIAGLAVGLVLTVGTAILARSTLRRRDADLLARETSLTRTQQELSLAQQDRARLSAELEAERRASAGRETLLRDSFAAVSRDALERNNRAFLDLAQTKLGEYQQSARVELDGRHKAIADLVQPLKESLARVGSDEEREAWFVDACRQHLRQRMNDTDVRTYEAADRFDLNWRGLARYWRKKGDLR